MTVVPFIKERKPKAFTWSYSRLKNFETCPRRYHEVDILKHFKDKSAQLDYGQEVHDAIAARLRSNREPLPVTMQRYEEEVAKLERFNGKLHVELSLSFDRQFRATHYYDKATWFRARIDALIEDGHRARIVDWKTGRVPEPGDEDYAQLATQAQAVFANYPGIELIGAMFVWLGDPVCYTRKIFTRQSLLREWNGIYPRLQFLVQAHDANVFPPKEGYLCDAHCPVKTCTYNGRNR